MIKQGEMANVYGQKALIKNITRDKYTPLWDLLETNIAVQGSISTIPTNYFYRWELEPSLRFNLELYNVKAEDNVHI